MTDEQIDAVARRVVEILRAERAAPATPALRTAVWGLIAQAESTVLEGRAMVAHLEHVKQTLG